MNKETIDMMLGKYPRMINKNELVKIAECLKGISKDELEYTFCGNPTNDSIVLIDILRNMLYYESITQDNQCMKSCAYDLDEFIINGNFRVLDDVAHHLEKISNAENYLCENNILENQHTIIEKWDIYKMFMEAREKYGIRGWNSLRQRGMKIENLNLFSLCDLR